MYKFFVPLENINKETITITGNDFNHIKNVLRLKKNDEILISDGHGHTYYCIIDLFKSNDIQLKIKEKTISNTELKSRITLIQGLPKYEKMEWIIQKAVELGVYEIIPAVTHRTVVKLNQSKSQKKLIRWNKIAESAAKQSHRDMIPKVHPMMTYKEALTFARTIDTLLIPYECAHNIKQSKDIVRDLNHQSVGVLIGPEGGFTENEVQEATHHGAKIITLGHRILRTETASLTTLAILMFELEEESNGSNCINC